MDQLSVEKTAVTNSSPMRFVLRVEMWNFAIVLTLMAIVTVTKWIDPLALLGGGLFMGVNFFLLSMGVCWIISPNASKRRQRLGMILLVLKLLLFLGLVSAIFFKLKLDAIAFIIGISSLLVATVIAGLSPVVDNRLVG